LAIQSLSRFDRDYRRWLANGWDTRSLLEELAQVQAWTIGQAALDASSRPFAGQDQRVAAALSDPRAREIMQGALGLRPVGVRLERRQPQAQAAGQPAGQPPPSGNASADPNALENALFANRPAQPPSQANTGQVVALSPARVGIGVAWAGVDADAVGTGTNGSPDGYADGHWRMTLSFESPQDVSYIAIKSADSNGVILAPHHWNTRDTRFWVLGVYANGQRVNAAHAGSLGTWYGTVYVDLYGANPGGWLVPGRFTLIEVGLANGQTVMGLAAL
jgi:hypothetical protein